MGRLIDADDIRGFAKYANYTEKEGEFTPYITLDNLVKLINEQPTAYDVDAVVEQLESESARWQDSGDEYNDEKEKGVAIGFRKAIEIVKKGGRIMDELCNLPKSNEKIKVESADIIVTGTKEKPYYEIEYKEVGKNYYNIGYSSYDLNNVFDWKNECFEIVKAECKIEAQARETTESKDPVWENNWTLCSERLPNEEEFIKAYRRNKYAAEFIVMIKGASRPTTLYFTHGGWWTDNMIDRYDVVAWMPLPEPLGVRE